MRNFLMIFTLVLLSNLAYAETVRLKTGVAFDGEIIELADDHVVLDRGKSGIFNLKFDQIDDADGSRLKTLPQVTRVKPQEVALVQQKEAQQPEVVLQQDVPQETVVPGDEQSQLNRMDTSIIKESGVLTKTADMNKDGKIDHWWYSIRDGEVLKIERDLDFSGTVSARQWTFKNKTSGKFQKILIEDVTIGKIAQIDYYDEQGTIKKIELASNNDEVVDVVLNCRGKILDNVQVSFAEKSSPDLILTFENGQFIKAEAPSGSIAVLNLDNLGDIYKWWQLNYPHQYQLYSANMGRFNVVP